MIKKFFVDLLHRFNKLVRSDIYFGDVLYMKRWRFGWRRSWGAHLHHIVRSDGDREFHDHPCWFVSIVLKGRYKEIRPNAPPKYRHAGSVAIRTSLDLHRVEVLDNDGCWTLFLRGAKKRDWGFVQCSKFQPWKDFVDGREESLGVSGEPGKYAAESSVGLGQR